MDVNLVAHLDSFDIIRSKARADSTYIYINTVALAFYTCIIDTLDYIRVLVVFKFHEALHVWSDQIGLCRHCIVRLTDGRELKDELHLIAADVIELSCLAELRSGWKEAVLGDLVVSNHIFPIRLLGIAAHHRKVTD